MRVVANIPGLSPILHDSRMLAAEMTHFIKEVQYYLLFEVLESCWHELQAQVVAARGLDDVIAAHNAFLDHIMDRMFLSEQHQVCRPTGLVTCTDVAHIMQKRRRP
eukprot:TRINITY_DN11344_c0_g1_i4.p2 TRINITY_DN11344_c0_g1~~TRINITY_DN11344_c0_g1_i4.p2  ORF type:complete len:106 (+),score=13.12 TRINITY_DN11344_c0_g1_i4:213-530(+)